MPSATERGRAGALASAPRRGPRGTRLAALAVGQVISWGILYYGIIVAAPAVADDTGWPLATIMLAFSAGLVTSALVGIPMGRWLDERSPRVIMTASSLVGAAGLALVSAAPGLHVFTLGWVIVGAAQAGLLYQAAFTVITRRYGPARRRAMTVVTLAGGLASTVFAPITATLLAATDWRSTLLLLAGVLAVTTSPLHWCTLERGWAPLAHAADGEAHHTVGSVLCTRRFWMLELAMIATAGALYAVTLAAIPLFTERGMTYELAAWGLGLLGAGQVIGRLVYVALPHSTAPWMALATTAMLSAASLALLALVPGPPWLLIAIGVAAGAVRGAQTLVQGSAVADRWGTRNYGAINGAFAAPVTVVAALGPALGPMLVLGVGSYASMALLAAGLALIGAVLARWS